MMTLSFWGVNNHLKLSSIVHFRPTSYIFYVIKLSESWKKRKKKRNWVLFQNFTQLKVQKYLGKSKMKVSRKSCLIKSRSRADFLIKITVPSFANQPVISHGESQSGVCLQQLLTLFWLITSQIDEDNMFPFTPAV